MEVQPQLQSCHLLQHNIYEGIKAEIPSNHQKTHNIYEGINIKSELSSTSQKAQSSKSFSVGCSEDMLFGVNAFNLHTPFCQPATNNNHETINHNSKMPNRKRPYPCNLCPSRFGSKMELEEHQNSHTGMKPFECDVCKARFNRRSTLWNHKRIHSDAKPFVCTVCQMTFKWKNSLKCHKEMHLRKNESSSVLDNDLRQLTYATAAKRRLMQLMEEGDGTNPATSSASSVHSQPLITTSSPKKKANKNNQHLSNAAALNQSMQQLSNDMSKSWLQSSLLHSGDHPLDLDTSSLDTLVHQSNQNLLVHLCSTDMDPRHASSLLTGDDPNSMLSNQLFADMKPEVNLLHTDLQDFQFNYTGNLLNTGMNNGNTQLNIPMPIVSNLVNIPRINGLNNSQQLPSVHHLTSTSLPSVSVNVDYNLPGENIQTNVAHPQYVVTSQPDMMLNQSAVSYQQQLDNCVVITSGQEYVPNFDYSMLSQTGYSMNESENPTQPMNNAQSQQQADMCGNDDKGLPFEQW